MDKSELTIIGRTKRIIMTLGIPASGKTRWSKAYVLHNPDTVRVNKDSLRLMVYGEPYKPEFEDLICELRDNIIGMFLHKGYNVIVDDTNFSEKHQNRIKEIAQLHNAEVTIKSFTDVPLEICLERNAARENRVPEEVIRRMHAQHIAKETQT